MKRAIIALACLLLSGCLLATGGKAAQRGGKPKVGFVVLAGAVPTSRTTDGKMLLGFLRAQRKLAITGRVVYVGPTEDPTGTLASLARQKYDLIIAAFPNPPAVASAAKRFPRTRFFMSDLPFETLPHPQKNVQGSDYRAGEASYLAGYLAALMEGRTHGKRAISAVGGVPFSGVTRWTVGYKAGAKKADPAIAVRIDYSQDFANPAKCRRVALSQIAKGSGVVFNVAGTCGLGALRAAKDKGVWGVGVDIDQSFLGPHILTSAVLRTDNSVFNTISKLVHGTFTTGGNSVFNLRNGGVELARVNPKVPRSFLRRVETIRKAIVAGRIRIHAS
jgi:basic membrane protein A